MNSRRIVICCSVAVCGLSVAGVVLRTRQLGSLREEGQRLQQQLRNLRDEHAKAVNPADAKPAITSPSAELLRLRNQVAQLMRRQRELANVPVENERLQTRIASARTNATRALPPDYIRTSE